MKFDCYRTWVAMEIHLFYPCIFINVLQDLVQKILQDQLAQSSYYMQELIYIIARSVGMLHYKYALIV